jgi:hypothetical protein
MQRERENEREVEGQTQSREREMTDTERACNKQEDGEREHADHHRCEGADGCTHGHHQVHGEPVREKRAAQAPLMLGEYGWQMTSSL